MSGESDLAKLLKNMDPALQPGDYVFCTLPLADPKILPHVIGSFREAEGLTCILPRSVADRMALPYDTTMAWITLQVHSSLEAVGLTAAVAQVLADAGISCNVVAAYYHDHLFVPVAHAARSVELLQKLSNNELSGR